MMKVWDYPSVIRNQGLVHINDSLKLNMHDIPQRGYKLQYFNTQKSPGVPERNWKLKLCEYPCTLRNQRFLPSWFKVHDFLHWGYETQSVCFLFRTFQVFALWRKWDRRGRTVWFWIVFVDLICYHAPYVKLNEFLSASDLILGNISHKEFNLLSEILNFLKKCLVLHSGVELANCPLTLNKSKFMVLDHTKGGKHLKYPMKLTTIILNVWKKQYF